MLGAIIGDIVGSVYEFNNIKTKDFPLFQNNSRSTDDTVMTLAVMEILQNGYISDNEKIVQTLKKWGCTFPLAGYGVKFWNWLFSKNSLPYNSCGNGSAMRISPVGFYAETQNEVKEFSKAVTAVTHNHADGLAGAEAVAMCIFYARKGASKEEIKTVAEKYYAIEFDYETLKREYRYDMLCCNSVPQAIFCFLISNNFEDCLRTTISIGGDCDTTAAIACAIAEAYYKTIPQNLITQAIKKLPPATNGCNSYEVLKKYYNEIFLKSDITLSCEPLNN